MRYLIGMGHNVPLLSLVALSPQPADGAVAFHENYSDGGVRQRAGFCNLVYNVSLRSIYIDLLDQTGLTGRLVRDITLYTWDEMYFPNRYNGTIVKPEFGEDIEWNRFFPRGIRFYVHSMSLST